MSTDASTSPQAQQVPLVDLTPAPWNPRTIKDEFTSKTATRLPAAEREVKAAEAKLAGMGLGKVVLA